MTGDQSAQVKQILEHARQLRIDFVACISAGGAETELLDAMFMVDQAVAYAIHAIQKDKP